MAEISAVRVVLASSANEHEMRALRDALDAEDAVTAATSATDAEQSKPAPDILEIALERGQVAPDAAVFVGDTVWDVEACKKAGLACIAFADRRGRPRRAARGRGNRDLRGPSRTARIPAAQPHRPVTIGPRCQR